MRAFVRASCIGAALTMAVNAPAQEHAVSPDSSTDEPNCKWPEIPSNHYCCPPGTTFVHGDCATAPSPTAPSAAASSPPSGPSSTPNVRSTARVDSSTTAQPATAVKAPVHTVQIAPALVCGDDACKDARLSVDGQAQTVRGSALLTFDADRDHVRVDVHVPGYEDYTTHVDASSGAVTLRAQLDPLQNLSIDIDSPSSVDPYVTVYVQRPEDDRVLGQCAIDVEEGTKPSCSMTLPQPLLGRYMDLRVAGNVALRVPHVFVCQAPDTTHIDVQVHSLPVTWWRWAIAGTVTAGTIGVLIGGSQTKGMAGDALMVTGAAFTGVDLLVGGWFVAGALAPRTESTVTITSCGPARFQTPATVSVPTTIASAAKRTSVKTALSPVGLGIQW